MACDKRCRRIAALLAIGLLCVLAGALRATAGDAAADGSVVWLCRPGTSGDPCAADLRSTTVVDGRISGVTSATPAPAPPFDCFYVYPTVSLELRANADLSVQPSERDAARGQASRFSTVCRVWAPIYRQSTLATLLTGGLGRTEQSRELAYESLVQAWKAYLARDNHGRPIVFIAHSQGSIMLARLLHQYVDTNPALRNRMVSALLIGGNVLVKTGSDAGGTFTNIPACRSNRQIGCVIAYSSFAGAPPANADFGTPGQGAAFVSGEPVPSGVSVLCTNPAALGGGSAPLDSYLLAKSRFSGPPTAVTTPWVQYPGLYRAQCRHAGDATWLDVTRDPRTTGEHPRLLAPPPLGLHLYDINLALGNLVADVAAQEAAYQVQHAVKPGFTR